MEQQRFTFKKNERLCSRTDIQELFTKGKSFVKYPFRVTYMPLQSDEKVTVQLLISVSKKRFKRAYKRNRVKRLVREAYRLNKHQLCADLDAQNLQLAVALIFLPNELPDFTTVEKGMKKALKKIRTDIASNEEGE